MDETELTRKAIEEIMREMDAEKEADKLPGIRERKLNPLGRPNKDFLDRTLNSVMTHNKRQLERNHRKCQNKLKDMDVAKAGEKPTRQCRERYRSQRKMKRKRRHSESATSLSSRRDSSSSEERKTKHKKSKKKKKRNKKARSKSSTSSSTSLDTSFSSSSSNSSNKSSRKRGKQKEEDFEADYEKDDFYPHQGEHLDPTSLGYYVDPNMALAAMAYSHMNQILQQQQQSMQDLVKEELENYENDDNKVDIPSDLSLTYNSESDLNISLNSSSAEEDENGVLTFKITSDEDETIKKPSTKSHRNRRLHTKTRRKRSKSKTSNEHESTLSDTSSEAHKASNKNPIIAEEITIISSSSSSDTEYRKEITTIISSGSSSSEADNNETLNKQEEITILSSCTSSSDTDDEDANKINEVETKTSLPNQDKDLETGTQAIETILGSRDLTNLGKKEEENVLYQSEQKQVEETIDIVSLSSSTNSKHDELEIAQKDTKDSNVVPRNEHKDLTVSKLSENKTQEETNSSLCTEMEQIEPKNDEFSFLENEKEAVTGFSKDEQNTKEKTILNKSSYSEMESNTEMENIDLTNDESSLLENQEESTTALSKDEQNTRQNETTTEANAKMENINPTNDESSFLENQEESTTALSKDEQNTKEKSTTVINNISYSDMEANADVDNIDPTNDESSFLENQEESKTALSKDMEENANMDNIDPTNDKSSFLENQEESTTAINKDEQTTKEKGSTILINSSSNIFETKESSCITAKSDSEEIEKDTKEIDREIWLSSPRQKETSASAISNDLECNIAAKQLEEITTEENKPDEKEIITNANDNSIILEMKEKDVKTYGKVPEVHVENEEVTQNCSVIETTSSLKNPPI